MSGWIEFGVSRGGDIIFCCTNVGVWSAHVGPHGYQRTVDDNARRMRPGPWIKIEHVEAARFTEETGG